jgi:hypothetical protein
MRSDEHDNLDRILDEGLSSYVEQEPASDLQGRVLRRTMAVGDRRKGLFIRWAFATAAAACLVMLVISQRSDRGLTVNTPEEQVISEVRPSPNESVPTSGAPAVPPESIAPEPASPRQQFAAPLPQQQEFPAYAPLTEQERALLAFVSNSPVLALDVLQHDQPSVSAEPIQIAVIEISPLLTEVSP